MGSAMRDLDRVPRKDVGQLGSAKVKEHIAVRCEIKNDPSSIGFEN
jgi:hypothetical protein